MTDTFKTAFGFKEGSQVTISKTTTQIVHADKVMLHDVTPIDFNGDVDAEDDCWNSRARYLLVQSEAVATGITLEVFNKKVSKKRFFVDHFESADLQPGTLALFFINDKTQIIISEPDKSNGAPALPISNLSQMGGLVEQVKQLDRRLDRLLHQQSTATKSSVCQHILLHGFEGTGKSSILDAIEERASGAFKVIRLDIWDLASTSYSKVVAKLDGAFADAASTPNQPCLVLLDDIDKWITPENEACANALARAVKSVRGSRVLAIATARTTAALYGNLMAAGRFTATIELPIPDRAARESILTALLGSLAHRETVGPLAQRTHAFTGKDLALLVEAADSHRLMRQEDEHDEWVQVHARTSIYNGVNGQVDGSVDSQASTEVDAGAPAHHANTPYRDPDTAPLTPADFDHAFKKVGPTALREVFFERPSMGWSDIGGSDAMKERFDEIIGWPVKYPDLMTLFRLKPLKGILLYGPPGCSKTLTAQAVAGTYDLNFIVIKGAELIRMYVGESERAVREVFRKAKQAAPCVVFFDEIDALGNRDDQKGLHVLTTLLNEMDGFEELRDVIVLAATNRPESLDPALIRQGRFDSHIYIGPPDAQARREIFNLSLKGLPKVECLDVEALIEDTDGYSGAEIVGIVGAAKRSAVRRNTDGTAKWSQDDFILATQQSPKVITDEMLARYEGFAKGR